MKTKMIGILVMTLLIVTVFTSAATIQSNNVGNLQPPIEWSQTFGGSEFEVGNCVQQTTDGGYIMTTYTEDHLLLKADSNGYEEWRRSLNAFEGLSVSQTSDGGYIIGAAASNWFGEARLIKTDDEGYPEWESTIRVVSNIR